MPENVSTRNDDGAADSAATSNRYRAFVSGLGDLTGQPDLRRVLRDIEMDDAGRPRRRDRRRQYCHWITVFGLTICGTVPKDRPVTEARRIPTPPVADTVVVIVALDQASGMLAL